MDHNNTLLMPVFNNVPINFKRDYIEPWSLSPFQRILLIANGTITQMIEAYTNEQIKLKKLSEEVVILDHDIPEMELTRGHEVVQRKILLQGHISRRNYIYAESILVLDRLEEKIRDELIKTNTPIGKVWVDQKVEIFKENIDLGKEPAEELAHFFKIDPADKLLFRTYSVLSNRQYTMMITEKFPEKSFLKNF